MNPYFRLFCEYYDSVANITFGHLKQLTVAFTATLLVVYGAAINNTIKRLIRGWPFVLRVVMFVFLCSAGYTALTLLSSRFIFLTLVKVDPYYVFPIVVGMFLFIGLLAEIKSHI